MTDAAIPAISIVVPTFNRLPRLKHVLDALSRQSIDNSLFEVVVVSDGATDGTDEYLSGPTPCPLVYAHQDNAGPGAARNRGVHLARGRLVLFIDDDVVATPTLVERHLQAHGDSTSKVVIGPMLNAPGFRYSPWVAWEQAKLEKQYRAMKEGVYSPTFRQFFTGNASVPRELFIEAGGFDTSFRRAEDVELSYRMQQLGATFVFDENAIAHHFAERSFASWIAAAEAYGRNDVRFARDREQHRLFPALAAEFRQRNAITQFLVRGCLTRPRLGVLASRSLRAIGCAPRMSPRVSSYTCRSGGLYALTYYSGGAAEYGDRSAFRSKLCAKDEVRVGDSSRVPTVAFILEQTLGHVTHADNLRNLVPRDNRIEAVFCAIPYEVDGWSKWIPRVLELDDPSRCPSPATPPSAARRSHDVGAVFIHTQVPSILAGRWMRRIPTVVSVDATPVQYDQFGAQYGHERSADWVERVKWLLNRRAFARAAHVVSWSEWTKQSLIADYEVPASKVTVLAPGVDIAKWSRSTKRVTDRSPVVKVLFVGGDLERKGGLLLIEAIRQVRGNNPGGVNGSTVELHLVTGADIAGEPGVVVHRGLRPNTPELIALYHSADVFCLPTLADCLPMVLSEAGAAGLPLVSTGVGAIPEIVQAGRTGLIVEPGSIASLVTALSRLVADADLRRTLGDNAAILVSDRFDAAKNSACIVDALVDVVANHSIRPQLTN